MTVSGFWVRLGFQVGQTDMEKGQLLEAGFISGV